MANVALAINPTSSYGLHVDNKNDEDPTCVIVPLTTNVSIACNIHDDHESVSSLPIAIISSRDVGMDSGIALDKIILP